MKLRLYHSFWSKPLLKKRYGHGIRKQITVTLLLASISRAYAKRIGAEIVLHTDEFGERLFDHASYDNIYPTLCGHDVHERFWASGKLLAHKAEPLGSCHIDYDVFLKSEKLKNFLLDNEADLIVQNEELCGFENIANKKTGYFGYEGAKRTVLENLPDKEIKGIIDFDSFNIYAYNCGLVKFNNQALKDEYINGYFYMLDRLKSNRKIIKILNNDMFECPDLFMEQWFLTHCARKTDARVRYILNNQTFDLDTKIYGYEHVIGNEKFEKAKMLQGILAAIDPVGLKRDEQKMRRIFEELQI